MIVMTTDLAQPSASAGSAAAAPSPAVEGSWRGVTAARPRHALTAGVVVPTFGFTANTTVPAGDAGDMGRNRTAIKTFARHLVTRST